MKRAIFFACLVFALSLFASSVHADTVTFASSTNVALESPSTTLTIASGSAAESLTVTATSVAVTLSASAGGAFTLQSPSYDLSVATSSSSGTISNTCASGLVTVVLTQTAGSATYTVTPTTQDCSTASPPILSGIAAGDITSDSAVITWLTNVDADSVVSYGATSAYGATSTDAALVISHSIALSNLEPDTAYHYAVTSLENGTSTTSGDYSFTTMVAPVHYVASGYAPAASPTGGRTGSASASIAIPTSSSTQSLAQIETALAELEAELQTLLREAAAKGIAIPSATTTAHDFFGRDLQLWDRGRDVNKLQRYLIARDSGPAAEALGRHGTTNTFGPLTLAALQEFQRAANIVPAKGYFGPTTRAYIEEHGK